MTRDEITRMAREAGFVGMDAQHGALSRFAALVAAAEREARARACQAAFDRGLKAGNEQSIAQQIEIHKLHDSLAAPNPPAVQETWPLELCEKTIATLTYIRGIAERGEGRPMRDDETLEQFLLGYVKRLEVAPNPPAFEHGAIDVFAANRFHVKPCDKRLFGWQVTAGDGEQTLYVGRKPDCENVARKLAGAFLDGAFYYSGLANAPQPPKLSDERIIELFNENNRGGATNVALLFARAIERELLGENQ